MKLHELTTPRKNAKGQVGRGIAAGQGKTAGRGTKGQKSRTGYKAPKRIPGMMSASDYRMPKRKGFTSHRPKVVSVTIRQVDQAFSANEVVNPDALVKRNVIKSFGKAGVKILATGQLHKKLIFQNVLMSKSLKQALGQSINSKSTGTKDSL